MTLFVQCAGSPVMTGSPLSMFIKKSFPTRDIARAMEKFREGGNEKWQIMKF
jgi:hypothetical protein